MGDPLREKETRVIRGGHVPRARFSMAFSSIKFYRSGFNRDGMDILMDRGLGLIKSIL